MKIIVDADACPVKEIIVNVATEAQVDVVMVCSYAHFLEPQDNVQIVQVDQEPQAADIAIINRTEKSDIIVTQDYGLAALVLGKGAYAISPRGKIYTEEKIDGMLAERHIQLKYRQSGGRTKGPTPHSEKDNRNFENNLKRLITTIKRQNSSDCNLGNWFKK
ncbi:MAG: YaiI/YqxD family protein [bacterium]|nr:YaiI/YqxD family protein [bacterium]